MPAYRLGSGSQPLAQYDVVTEDASGGTPNFVVHVGMAAGPHEAVNNKDPVSVAHMGPPLETAGTISAHAIGSAELTTDEVFRIQLFLDELDSEYAAHLARDWDQFTIHPHCQPLKSSDGTPVTMGYSCVGLTIEAYKDAGIDFIKTEESGLPPVSLSTIQAAYPHMFGHGDRPKLRARCGIAGSGPWPVVLAGYVLHALNRLPAQIRAQPYQPVVGNEIFP